MTHRQTAPYCATVHGDMDYDPLFGSENTMTCNVLIRRQITFLDVSWLYYSAPSLMLTMDAPIYVFEVDEKE